MEIDAGDTPKKAGSAGSPGPINDAIPGRRLPFIGGASGREGLPPALLPRWGARGFLEAGDATRGGPAPTLCLAETQLFLHAPAGRFKGVWTLEFVRVRGAEFGGMVLWCCLWRDCEVLRGGGATASAGWFCKNDGDVFGYCISVRGCL